MGLFQYNGISLKNEDSAQKVGTDSILLGNWLSPLPSDMAMLDIGTGTGVLALMAAQKRERADSDESWKIIALEIDAPSCAEAQFNFEASPWAGHLSVLNIPLQDYLKSSHCPKGGFDYIFTNPPYFINSLKAPNARRNDARHASSLTHEEIIEAAFQLLKPSGRLALILPAQEAEAFRRIAELYHIGRALPEAGERRCLRLSRLEKVQTAPGKPVKRWLMEFTVSSDRC